uniref:Uncharacterized protein n=1 Tax=Spermophilus dauricus TaxID=99837 RepID=A0A8C9P4E7_SPEDA
MMTYNLILKGIEKMDFPRKITRRPEDLIRRLCRQNPTERLGNLKNGIYDIKKHRSVVTFLWDGVKKRWRLVSESPFSLTDCIILITIYNQIFLNLNFRKDSHME